MPPPASAALLGTSAMTDPLPSSLPQLILKSQSDRRLRAGHLWIYSNEVDTQRSPLKPLEPGASVTVVNHRGKALGTAHVSPNALICARLISRNADQPLDRSLLVHRFKIALGLRQRFFQHPCYRLVYGDSDQLPGLVVDRFNDVLVVQIATAGMERLREEIVEALVKVIKPRAILLKNDARIRSVEQLPEYVETVYGDVPESVELIENGVRFIAPLAGGQKTGWFYDHGPARARLPNYVRGRRVLDVFSYVGGWGIQAAVAGADSVVCVDSSSAALAGVEINAQLNQVGDRVSTLQGSAFDVLKELSDQGERFDAIIVDPPAFIPKRKDQAAGETAYRRINELALRLLSDDSCLISASCSMHLPRERLVDILRGAARHVDRQMQILEHCGQGVDHPVHPSIPETEYLKSVFTRIRLPD